jgi:hypothetical protein
MDFAGISLVGRAEFLSSYPNDSEISLLNETPSIPKEGSSPSPLQIVRFKTQDIAQPVIQKKASPVPPSPLKEYREMTWIKVISRSPLEHLIKRTIESQQKTLFWIIKEQRMIKYRETCWAVLKQNFHEYIKRRQLHKEE